MNRDRIATVLKVVVFGVPVLLLYCLHGIHVVQILGDVSNWVPPKWLEPFISGALLVVWLGMVGMLIWFFWLRRKKRDF